jgi:hypothetical protein
LIGINHPIGAVSAPNSTYNPTVISQGAVITQGKYVVINGQWGTSSQKAVFTMWFFHISGTMGRYANFRNDVRLQGYLYRTRMDSPTGCCLKARFQEGFKGIT